MSRTARDLLTIVTAAILGTLNIFHGSQVVGLTLWAIAIVIGSSLLACED